MVDDATVLVVSGPLDERSVAGVVTRAGELLDGAAGSRLVVDVTAMDFMDSSGIGGLITMHSLAIAADTTMVLRGTSAQALALLDRVGLGSVLHVER